MSRPSRGVSLLKQLSYWPACRYVAARSGPVPAPPTGGNHGCEARPHGRIAVDGACRFGVRRYRHLRRTARRAAGACGPVLLLGAGAAGSRRTGMRRRASPCWTRRPCATGTGWWTAPRGRRRMRRVAARRTAGGVRGDESPGGCAGVRPVRARGRAVRADHAGYVRRVQVVEEMLVQGRVTLAGLETELAGASRPRLHDVRSR